MAWTRPSSRRRKRLRAELRLPGGGRSEAPQAARARRGCVGAGPAEPPGPRRRRSFSAMPPGSDHCLEMATAVVGASGLEAPASVEASRQRPGPLFRVTLESSCPPRRVPNAAGLVPLRGGPEANWPERLRRGRLIREITGPTGFPRESEGSALVPTSRRPGRRGASGSSRSPRPRPRCCEDAAARRGEAGEAAATRARQKRRRRTSRSAPGRGGWQAAGRVDGSGVRGARCP